MDLKENSRLKLLRDLEVLDTAPEREFDEITRLATLITGAPISVISLLDDHRQWFKSKIGIEAQATPRDVAFCNHTIAGRQLFVVPDAHLDDRFKNNPLVTGDPRIRFYAGAPLVLPEGAAVGALCVIDQAPHEMCALQREALSLLASQVVQHLSCRRAYHALRRLKDSFEAQTSGMLVENADGDIVMLNQALGKTLGLGEVHLDDHLAMQTQFANPSAFAASTKRVREMGMTLSQQEFELADGRWIERDYAPLWAEGKLDSHIWIYRDVTERRKDAYLLEYHKLQMVESQRLSALGEMAGGLAHEVNNPLTVIYGRAAHLVEMSASPSLDSTVVGRYAQEIVDVTNRVMKIIKGLRSFARVGDNDPMEATSISGIVDSTLAFCQQKIRGAGVELRLPALNSDVQVMARATQVSQILLNLMNNAFDAIKDLEKKWIEVDAFSVSDEAVIAVSDSGKGVPKEVRDKIFDPFFTTKDADHGTGLGLSISRRIAEEHGGRLELDLNSPMTRFVLRLPLVKGG